MTSTLKHDATATQPTAGQPLKVVFLCNTDDFGGAAIVTRRLVHALVDEGVDARMVVFNRVTDDPLVEAASNRRQQRGIPFLKERLRIYLRNGMSRENLFKVSLASDGLRLDQNETVRNADIIVLSWINQGMLSISGIERLAALGKPMLWVMHDMWNMTGICHHAYECHKYFNRCGRCMFLNSEKDDDLSRRTQQLKEKLYDKAGFHFIAVSNWLAGCAANSSLLGKRDVRVIHNAFPIKSFYTKPVMELPFIPRDRKIILMGASRLDDPIKGFDIAIESLNYVFDNYPEMARESIVLFFGNIRNHEKLDNLRFPYQELGIVNDANMLREIYASASVIISTSLYETLPGTLIEGQAAGALPVTFGMGGQGDIVDHRLTGYIARYKDSTDFGEGIVWALNQQHDREMLHEQVRERFSAHQVALEYIDLFNELLGRKVDEDTEEKQPTE